MTPHRRGAKPLASFMPAIIGETLAARGIGEASLISSWPAIVGEAIAGYARPIQLQWPPRASKGNPDATASATLILRVDGAFALEAQHASAIIAERVNAHLGWRCVGKVAFRQGPLPLLAKRKTVSLRPNAKAEAEARAAAAGIETDALREAVARLGALALDRAGRLDAAAHAVAPRP